MLEVEFKEIRQNKRYYDFINKVIKVCFEEESLIDKNININVILTTPEEIKRINKQFRKVDKETDVLSFPMFTSDEITHFQKNGSTIPEILGDIVISVDKVKKQAKEYEHSFERELAYMVVHGFYHCMGYDHILDEDKIKMRKKEEIVLEKIGLGR